jgi:hypothetical protein
MEPLIPDAPLRQALSEKATVILSAAKDLPRFRGDSLLRSE